MLDTMSHRLLDTLAGVARSQELELKGRFDQVLASEVDAAQTRQRKTLERVVHPDLLAYFKPHLSYTTHCLKDFEKDNHALKDETWYLIPQSLPLEMQKLVLVCKYDPGYTHKGAQLALTPWIVDSQSYSRPFQTAYFQEGEPLEKQQAALARVLLPAVEQLKESAAKERADEERKQREAEERLVQEKQIREAQQRYQELFDRLTQEHRTALLETRARLQEEREEFLRNNSWPEGREVRLSRIVWVAAVGEEGCHEEEAWWVPQPEEMDESGRPRLERAITVLEKGEFRLICLVLPNGYRLYPEVWRSLKDVPYPHSSFLVATRQFHEHVLTTGTYRNHYGYDQEKTFSNWVELEAVHYPSGALRALLGMPPLEESASRQPDEEDR